MQRYFVSNENNGFFYLNRDDSYHVIKVMRMRLGDSVEIVYDNKLYLSSIFSMSNEVCCKMEKLLESTSNCLNVSIAQALVKEQKMDYILQKSCELGVKEIIPINTSRSVVKISNEDTKKIVRWNRILKEASEQSKRCDIPVLNKVLDVKDLINLDYKYKFLCSVNEKSKTIKTVLSNLSISDTIIFVIGPEGGFSLDEEELLCNAGFVPISLGSNVLRTETASSFIFSVLNYEFMR